VLPLKIPPNLEKNIITLQRQNVKLGVVQILHLTALPDYTSDSVIEMEGRASSKV